VFLSSWIDRCCRTDSCSLDRRVRLAPFRFRAELQAEEEDCFLEIELLGRVITERDSERHMME
jgi:hypothetical protein